MGKLILHVGPPKTASTALQFYLQNLKIPALKFCGTFQPRETNKDSISYRLIHLLRDYNSTSAEEIKSDIDRLIQEYEFVIISEEVFLLHEETVSILSKIKILSSLFESYDPLVVITIRNPEGAIPSYYQELYSKLPKGLQSDFNAFTNSDYCLAYDYQWVVTQFRNNGLQNLNLILFKDLVENKLSLDRLIGEERFVKEEVVLSKSNQGKVDGQQRVLRKKSFTENLVIYVSNLAPKRKTGLGKIILPILRKLRPKVKSDLKVSDEILHKFQAFKSGM